MIATLVFASAAADAEPRVPDPGRHLIYVEAFGKAGAYGVGYELAIAPRLSFGGVVSALAVRGQWIATASPYLHATLVRRGNHAMFGELGGALVHSRIASPVMDWNGSSDTGAGGVAALGWERAARHLVIRAQASLLVGEGGAAPWGGFAIGFRP